MPLSANGRRIQHDPANGTAFHNTVCLAILEQKLENCNSLAVSSCPAAHHPGHPTRNLHQDSHPIANSLQCYPIPHAPRLDRYAPALPP